MFHLQTIVLGFFPFRLHAYKGRDVTHLMDDPIVGDAATGRGGTRGRPPVPARRDRRARWERPPDHGGDAPPARCRRTARSWPTRRRATRWSRSRCRARTCPQATNRVDLDGGVRDVWGFPAGRITYSPHAHDVGVRAPLGAAARAGHDRGGRARARRGSRRPARRDRARPTSSRCRSTGWAPPAWGATRRRRCAIPWQRLWDVDNVVVADSSVFPTSTGYGPTLTLVALAIRASRALAALVVTGVMGRHDRLRRRRRAVRRAARRRPTPTTRAGSRSSTTACSARRGCGRRTPTTSSSRSRGSSTTSAGWSCDDGRWTLRLDAAHDVDGRALVAPAARAAGRRRWSGGHVAAKRYLLATDPAYAALLSARSEETLGFQGGVMTRRRGGRRSSGVPTATISSRSAAPTTPPRCGAPTSTAR